MNDDLSDRIQLRVWSQLLFHDPATVLRKYWDVAQHPRITDLSPAVRELRTNDLRWAREGRQAALLCEGLSQGPAQTRIFVSPTEADDYDAVAVWRRGAERVFTPIQLKEAPTPGHLNGVLHDLQKYRDPRLAIGVHLSGEGCLDLRSIEIPPLSVGSVWVFAASSPDQKRWILVGDLMTNPAVYQFEYPN